MASVSLIKEVCLSRFLTFVYSLTLKWDSLKNFRPRTNSFKAPSLSTPIPPSKPENIEQIEVEKETSKRLVTPEVAEGPSAKRQKVQSEESEKKYDISAFEFYFFVLILF